MYIIAYQIPRLSRTLQVDFQEKGHFPGLSRSWKFSSKNSRTFQDFPGGVETLLLVSTMLQHYGIKLARKLYSRWLIGKSSN